VEEKLPAAIVCVQPNQSWLWQPSSPPDFQDFLLKLLRSDYQLVGGYVWIGKKGWQAPLPPAKTGNCSLLLFKRVSHNETKQSGGLGLGTNSISQSKR
jgi:hypothetical protein